MNRRLKNDLSEPISLRACFVLFDGFSNMVLACLLEPLRAVRDQEGADIQWEVRTCGSIPVRSSSGIPVSPSEENFDHFELLVIVSGYNYHEHASQKNLLSLRELVRKSKIVIGADTGAWLLAEAGILAGQRATAHWSLLPEFRDSFPDISVMTVPYVNHGPIWTCGGASSALDLILRYISDELGKECSFFASSMFVHDYSAKRDEHSGLNAMLNRGGWKLRQVVKVMTDNIETPLTIGRLCEVFSMSRSSLARLFLSELNVSPKQYYQILRLARARDLASTSDFTVCEIALRCGYADGPALAKAFTKAYGQPLRRVVKK